MKVFIWSDPHFPFHSKVAYKHNIEKIKELRPDAVVNIGDLKDKYVFSKYPRSQSFISPKQEIEKAFQLSVKMWDDISKVSPNSDLYQLLGNHDLRTAKRISDLCPELEVIYSLEDDYKFKGVKTLKSDKDFLELDGVVYCHGWLTESIDHAKYFNKPCVHGHRHKPGIFTFGSKLWSMDTGYTADKNTLPLQYTPSTMKHWRLASGLVDNKEPRLYLIGDK